LVVHGLTPFEACLGLKLWREVSKRRRLFDLCFCPGSVLRCVRERDSGAFFAANESL